MAELLDTGRVAGCTDVIVEEQGTVVTEFVLLMLTSGFRSVCYK